MVAIMHLGNLRMTFKKGFQFQYIFICNKLQMFLWYWERSLKIGHECSNFVLNVEFEQKIWKSTAYGEKIES